MWSEMRLETLLANERRRFQEHVQMTILHNILRAKMMSKSWNIQIPFRCLVRLWNMLYIENNGCDVMMSVHMRAFFPVPPSSLNRSNNVQEILSSSSSSCSLRVRCIPRSLVLKVELVPPSLLRSSNVPSFFSSLFQCLSWQSISVHPLYVL